jgi:hypothetical protein
MANLRSAKKTARDFAGGKRLAHRCCNTRKGAVIPVIPWPAYLILMEPAPLIAVAERLDRKGGREVVVRCADRADAEQAADWLVDRFSRLAPRCLSQRASIPVVASLRSHCPQHDAADPPERTLQRVDDDLSRCRTPLPVHVVEAVPTDTTLVHLRAASQRRHPLPIWQNRIAHLGTPVKGRRHGTCPVFRGVQPDMADITIASPVLEWACRLHRALGVCLVNGHRGRQAAHVEGSGPSHHSGGPPPQRPLTARRGVTLRACPALNSSGTTLSPTGGGVGQPPRQVAPTRPQPPFSLPRARGSTTGICFPTAAMTATPRPVPIKPPSVS